MASKKQTTVGNIDQDILAFTAGKDVFLDLQLADVDCIGTAAHVTMLADMDVKPKIISKADAKRVRKALQGVRKVIAEGKFKIRTADQDVHLAVERMLTKELGDLGKKIHTARSRNDQVSVDLRLFAKRELISLLNESAALAAALVDLGERNKDVPMVGRTHMQPAMPSSVGLWATAFAEGVLDDIAGLMHVYELNDQCPLGAAAGYGVPLPIDRQQTSDLLGFSRPIHNVAFAVNARGKLESQILQALSQLMLTISRIAQDLMLYTLPEFAYFSIPKEFGTGSSIMPNKNNPDVLELLRSKAALLQGHSQAVQSILLAAPSGYNRDLQDAKEPFLEGLGITRASVRILAKCIEGVAVHEDALIDAFDGGVFATDRALELVAGGMPFRDAYHHVKATLDELENLDPRDAIAKKTHLGGTAGLDFAFYKERIANVGEFAEEESTSFEEAVTALMKA